MSYSTLRLAVTGLKGQVVTSLIERAPKNVEIIALGRPQLDLSVKAAVLRSLRHAGCDAIINAAAYTQVDKAESEPEVAMKVNGFGAEIVAEAASQLDVPLLHLSTDYVFDGLLDRPYLEGDITSPVGAYGRSKLEGEMRIKATYSNHFILRTSWVYSPFGANFVKTMLLLGQERSEISVVADQIGNPTNAIDIAERLIQISEILVSNGSEKFRGVFHLTGRGQASWAQMAQAIFSQTTDSGRAPVRVREISSEEYPTPAKRPQNSRLDNSKIKSVFGIEMPLWKDSLYSCVERLIREQKQGS